MEQTLKIIKIASDASASTYTGDIRIACWENTVDKCMSEPSNESVIYYNNLCITPKKVCKSTTLHILNEDCIYTAIKYAHGRTCILNMADWKRAGGLVRGGSKAQEEELFRRSNLHKHLHQKYYPMCSLQTVYSHGVKFFKFSAEKYYAQMEEPFVCDVISAPALSNVDVTDDGQFFANSADEKRMYEKIRQLFLIAIKEGVDTLVLSAWGCGAFNGPSMHIAQLFKRALNEFNGYIKIVVFAILGYNYNIFKDVLLAGI